ncbi:hypothetical protein SLS62_000011 [Diatrype stigma]|uniref:F-box domain-containing protein n=1 Tax=Diatrype stigma TaxID=117547 RepID=A0AAN9UXZ4_9PEZI
MDERMMMIRQRALLRSGKFRHAMPFPKLLVPLTFDRVMKGRAIAAESSRLLALPVELLSFIVQYIAADKGALANLARVNSDCRQLARSCQFHCLNLELNVRAFRILDVLRKENVEKLTSREKLARRPSLGACVCHLRVNCCNYDSEDPNDPKANKSPTRGLQFVEYHRDMYLDPILFDSEDATKSIDQAMSIHTRNIGVRFPPLGFIDHYTPLPFHDATINPRCFDYGLNYSVQSMKSFMPDILGAISNLPHLKSLSLLNCSLSDDLVDSLTRSSVTHLRLFGVIRNNLRLAPGRGAWRLESLGISFQIDSNGGEKSDISPFCGRLLSLCCSTLRFLKLEKYPRDLLHEPPPSWFHHKSPKLRMQKPLPLWFNLEFPKLRTLLLFGGVSLAPSSLACLLQASLHNLRIQYCDGDEMIIRTLSRVKKHPTLKTLIIEWLRSPGPKDLDFIRENTGIQSLVLIGWTHPTFKLHVANLLEHHKGLRLLSLNWENDSFDSEEVIIELESLTSIEVLHLNISDTERWHIDHAEISRHLSSLTNLKRLIYEGDYYHPGGFDIYFPDDLERDEQEWLAHILMLHPLSMDNIQPGHHDRMLHHAETYMDTFPKLERLHVGRLLITIKKDKNGHRRPLVMDTTAVRERGYDFVSSELGLEGPVSNEWYVKTVVHEP